MAKFKKLPNPWVPYGTITVSAREVDALRNLLKWYFEGQGQRMSISAVHHEDLRAMLDDMDIPGGPFSA